MQQQMGQLEDDLSRTKNQLTTAEEQRDQAIDELKEMKKVAQETTIQLTDAMSSNKLSNVYTELNTVKEALHNSSKDLKMKERNIETMKRDLEKTKQVELKLAEKEAALAVFEEKFKVAKFSEVRALDSLSESKKRVHELEVELEKQKESERKMFDSLVLVTNQLEQTKISYEDSKLEIASLKRSQSSSKQVMLDESLDGLKAELDLTKQNLAFTQESEELSTLKAQNLIKEIGVLRNELKLATDAENTGKKAMDDLALALKEVATEYNQTTEKLIETQDELEYAKEEVASLKLMVQKTEDTYKGLLDEAKKKADRYKNTSERLSLEAEDSIMAWNGKEMGFVACMKRVEEDRTSTQQENKRLLLALLEAEKMTKHAKEENHKLRDILKQALNEANVAKEAATIARTENSQLKDCLAEKERALEFLEQEVENLKLQIAQAQGQIKELNHMLSLKTHTAVIKEHQDSKKLGKAFSFDLNELRIPVKTALLPKQKDVEEVEEDPEKAEALKGSIFDTESPKLALLTPPPIPHHRRKPSSTTATDDGGETMKPEDLDHLDELHYDETEIGSRKKKALMRRVSDLLRRRSFHHRSKEEIIVSPHTSPHPSDPK